MKRFYKFLPLLLISLLHVTTARVAQAQTIPLTEGGYLVKGYQIPGDTIPYTPIREVVIFRQRIFKNKRDYEAYWKLVRNFKKVYPYALVARKKFKEIDSVCATLNSDFARRRYIAKVQRELSKEFEEQLKELTFSQGRLLFKLIDRETGRTTYEIIREFRGTLTAMFWQGVATLFSSDLKSKFDNESEENKIINELIIQYEHGQL
jgi:hypothetical protein